MTINLNKYFADLQKTSELIETIKGNLRVAKAINDFGGLAAGTEKAIKKHIPLAENRILTLHNLLNIGIH